MSSARPLRIGAGAGFSGDRLEPAVILAERAGLDFLVLECLAERTIAIAQRQRLADPSQGFDQMLRRRMELLLPVMKRRGVRLITNMGAANPIGGAKAVLDVARQLGLPVKVAAVTGDDVLSNLAPDTPLIDAPGTLADVPNVLSANAYIGAAALQPALASGADVVIAGRVADPSLFVAAMVAHFGWSLDDRGLMAKGTAIGHLLECAGQLTGGYFADPGSKDVPGLATLGFPFAEIEADGRAVIGKPEGTGGRIDLRTAKEQLLYEVLDPTAYLTPDSAADFTTVDLVDLGHDRVAVDGATGGSAPATLKVSIGYHAGLIGEGEISYAGRQSLERARLAGEIVRERLAGLVDDLRVDLIGLDSTHRRFYGNVEPPYEVRLRVAGRAGERTLAERVGEEVEALYTNGPAGGGGARKLVREIIGVVSCLVPRDAAKIETTVMEFRP